MVEFIIGGALILLTIALVTVILMQTGKDKSLSGTLSGASSDTYFGKSGGSNKDKMLFKLTIVGTVLFAALTIVLVILI